MGIEQNVNQIKQQLALAEIEFNLPPESVLLLAVSKQQSVDSIREAYALGVTDFGENYFQEGQAKIDALKDLAICWHFIGPIQSNKCKGIASHYDWVQSINRQSIALKLNTLRPADLPPLNVCLQINLIEEETKSGIDPTEAANLALAVSQLPRLRLRGLMTIPPPQQTTDQQFEMFMQLNHLMHKLNDQCHLQMDTLSMGMSEDFIPAIKAGSTIVRIGQAIFGKRKGKME